MTIYLSELLARNSNTSRSEVNKNENNEDNLPYKFTTIKPGEKEQNMFEYSRI